MNDSKLKYPLEYKSSPDYTGVWDSDDNVVFGIITDGGDRPVYREWACQIGMSKHQLAHVVGRLNALAGINNPAQFMADVKELCLEIQARALDGQTCLMCDATHEFAGELEHLKPCPMIMVERLLEVMG